MSEENGHEILGPSSKAAPDYQPKTEDDFLSRIIPYRNQPALIGYYLSVFGLIPCLGLPLAPAAIPLGIVGLKRARREAEARGKIHAWVAIILGSLSSIVWIGLIGLMLYGRLHSGHS